MPASRLTAALLCALLALAGAADGADAKKKRKKKKATTPRVLVYSGTIGFRHNSIPYANATVQRLGRLTKRFDVTGIVEDPKALTGERLAKTDIVLWNSTTGAESPFSDAQQAAYEAWVSCGGGHAGVHASTDSYRDWPAWEELTGAFFKRHPITPTSVLDDQYGEADGWGEPEAEILVTDQESPITAPWHGKESFLLHDEFYALDRDPSKVVSDFRPLLAFGGFTDPVVTAAFGADYAPEQPLSWTGTYKGRNRIFYTNLGHSIATWYRPDFQDALIEGLSHVAGKRPRKKCLRAAGLL